MSYRRRGVAPRLAPYRYEPVSDGGETVTEWRIVVAGGGPIGAIVARLTGPEWVALDLAIALNRRHRAAEHIRRRRERLAIERTAGVKP